MEDLEITNDLEALGRELDALNDGNNVEEDPFSKNKEDEETKKDIKPSKRIKKEEAAEIIKEAKEAPLKPREGKTKLLKDDLVSEVLRLQTLLPVKPISKTKLKRMKNADLEQKIAELTEIGANEYFEPGSSPDEGTVEGGNTEYMPRMREDAAANALFQLNLILASIAESASISYEDKLGSNLEGMRDDMLENREALREALADIYLAHSEMLDNYISPMNRYGMMMLSIAGNRFMANKDKVKKKDGRNGFAQNHGDTGEESELEER